MSAQTQKDARVLNISDRVDTLLQATSMKRTIATYHQVSTFQIVILRSGKCSSGRKPREWTARNGNPNISEMKLMVLG